ncbi:nucleotide exchange factor GrpE [Candidatus Saccharibacteria bacterium]|nr:nucleotide exchange factor GrpE [Candidatus Saccharibacteria bacterium]
MVKDKKQQQSEDSQQQADLQIQEELAQELAARTEDLQRTRADFENYRKRMEQEKQTARSSGEMSAILKLLPVIDNIERAIGYMPEELKENKWAQGISGLAKNLEKSFDSMNLRRIDAAPGTAFNPELHEAIQFDEEAEGDHEIIAEELQAGYVLNGLPIRHAMVKVTKK